MTDYRGMLVLYQKGFILRCLGCKLTIRCKLAADMFDTAESRWYLVGTFPELHWIAHNYCSGLHIPEKFLMYNNLISIFKTRNTAKYKQFLQSE